jgi:hypothetical protein
MDEQKPPSQEAESLKRNKSSGIRIDSTVMVAAITTIGTIAAGIITSIVAPIITKQISTPTAPSPSTPSASSAPTPTETAPKPDAKENQPVTLLKETFDNNQYGWSIWENGKFYNSSLQGGHYSIEGKNEKSSVEVITPPFDKPKNFDLEVTAKWKEGSKTRPYALVFGVDANTYYSFNVNANGEVGVWLTEDSKPQSDPISWKGGLANVSDGSSSNKIRIEVRDNSILYYVDNKFGGRVKAALWLTNNDKWAIGVMVAGIEKVSFDDLIMTKK